MFLIENRLDIMGIQKWAVQCGLAGSSWVHLKVIPLSAVFCVFFFFLIILGFLVLHLYSESNKEKEISLTVFLS